MGPERKTQLKSTEALEGMSQETTAIVATTQRLMAEMDELMKRAKQLMLEQKALVTRSRNDRRK